MFDKVTDAEFIRGEHQVLRFWEDAQIFRKLRQQNADKPRWSFLDGPITANNPMGVHHAWGRTYKDAFQRFFAMKGHQLRYQNGFDCQGLWVEVEVEKELGRGTKNDIVDYGIDRFVNACKQRVLRFAARQTEQSIRLGFWMDWDTPDELRKLADGIGTDESITLRTPSGQEVSGPAHQLVGRLGNPEWGGSYFTFSTENNETIWTFLKKCFQRGKVYRGHDVMPWSGRGGSAYSQMEVADGRRLTTHRSCFVRFPILRSGGESEVEGGTSNVESQTHSGAASESENIQHSTLDLQPSNEYLLVWTTTPWTLTSNVAAAVNPDLDYVRLKTKRDGATYYFAADNLEFQRLAREFKEGFGRPEWQWPDGVPKLKTIAQIFKEQGGYEIDGTIKGAEMVGWRYQGPFDELDAQQRPGGFPEGAEDQPSAVQCHQVIDGGRDFKGNPHVVAGEGTGIVHIAPGCGDVDHQLGQQHGLVGIAPLEEDGRFAEGFGAFTGREAIDPETADLVFETLKQKHLLVAVETYPHIYPHCWRTGDELVFRLVDEWFIDMDWRDEIMDVTRSIRWLPEEIQGQEREVEWLTNMRDWMISKKRFWGLALPIWVNPDDPSDFEVIGSLAELKDRAVEGWDEFEGNTPHRPWIDKVKIRSEKTGAVLTRVPDVGNPWLDAGIVPFSTMQYNTNREEWANWFPADFVTECFPGQFRNWFYSLLATATMMRHAETDDPEQKRPFKTLLGHRLVMNEEGQPMHKSDGTAIWFEEAAEQIGVDTLRWLYLAQNPSQDLRFGTRHPDERVKLETPAGPIEETLEGLPTCKVTSGPADEVRRQILIPLWNSYKFFVNYARLEEFDPTVERLPVAQRCEGDRWILSNLQMFLKTANERFAEFDTPAVCSAAAGFIDDLSNWYIRRNRRRFYRLKDADDTDNLAAFQTLHEVLVTLSKALAPCIPFLSERMYQNLVVKAVADRAADDVPESVHLCPYPEPDKELLDPAMNRGVTLAQRLARMGHKMRDEASQRVRQPLAELRYVCTDEEAAAIAPLTDVVADEINVKKLTRAENLDGLVSYSYKPNLKTLGPKYGKLLGKIRQQLPEMDPQVLAPLRSGEEVTVSIADESITLQPDDVMVSTEQAADWVCADDSGLQAALSTEITPELAREGMARDFVRAVQQLRKENDLEIEQRINIIWSPQSPDEDVTDLREMLEQHAAYISAETLADSLREAAIPAPSERLAETTIAAFPRIGEGPPMQAQIAIAPA